MGFVARLIRQRQGLTGDDKLKAAMTKCEHQEIKFMVYGFKCVNCGWEAVWKEPNIKKDGK